MKKYLAELIGTFAIVFCGTGAIIINEKLMVLIGHAGITFCWLSGNGHLIYTFGNKSGAHFNPAVTIGFTLAKNSNHSKHCLIIVTQTFGAFLASFTLKFLFPENINLGATLPARITNAKFYFRINSNVHFNAE